MCWRRKWQPTPVFVPRESHGQRSLACYSPRGRKESDTTELLQFTSLYVIPSWLSGKGTTCQAGDADLIPVSGRSPGEGNSNPLQDLCLGNPMDRGT